MSDISIRKTGKAGRITLTRPDALNALTHDMVIQIDRALSDWQNDPQVSLVVIDAMDGKAFCAGGDLRGLYEAGNAGDASVARSFWRDEYAMNARIAHFPKPVVSFLHGFVMGGGVGLGCHASHRIVCENTQVSMPETSIGLVPDAGGSLLLARAPGRLGDYLALTACRVGAGDAIHAGFADYFVPFSAWTDLKARLIDTGNADGIAPLAERATPGRITDEQDLIDALFASRDLSGILQALDAEADDGFIGTALAAIRKNAPLAMACSLQMLVQLHDSTDIYDALVLEYRYAHRAIEGSDFLEGIRAQIIDRDRKPHWTHAEDVPEKDIQAMLAPLGADELSLAETA